MKKESIYRIFYGLFAFCFGFISLKILFRDTFHNYNLNMLLLYLLLGFFIIGCCNWVFKKQKKFIEKYFPYILFCFSICYGLLLIYFGFTLRFTPAFDMDAIYGGAIQWLKEGTFSNYYDYYGYFPNNLGAMTFLHSFFKIASFFGIRDFFGVGIVINSLLIVSTVLVTSLVCKKIHNTTSAMLSLIFYLLCVPFYFMGAAFYTDSLSLLFPVLFYYLYLCFKEQTTTKKRVIYALLMAFVLTQGMLIKFTVVIILVAVIIDSLLSINLKKTCLMAGTSIAIAAIVFGSFQSYIYSAHLDKEQHKQLNTPYLHWVMMGLQNNGYYNPEDYVYTRSFSLEDRNKACLERIKERVLNSNMIDLSHLFANKATICFGDGTYALSDFLDDQPAKKGGLHQYILYEGQQYKSYQNLTTGFLLCIYTIMVFGASLCTFRKNKPKDFYYLAPRLAGLGILAFLLLWETSGRYFTNFIPLLIVSAVVSITWKDWRHKYD